MPDIDPDRKITGYATITIECMYEVSGTVPEIVANLSTSAEDVAGEAPNVIMLGSWLVSPEEEGVQPFYVSKIDIARAKRRIIAALQDD